MSASKSKQLKAGTLLSYAQTIAGIVIALIYTPAMLRLLGKTEYGLYNIAASIISYVKLLNLGFSSSYVRFYSRDKAANDYKALARTNGLFCIVFMVIGVLALFSGIVLTACARLIFSTGLSESEYVIARTIMAILTVSTAYNLSTSIFSSIIIAHEQFIFHKTVNLIKTILSPALTWVLLMRGYRSIMMASVTAGLTVVADTFYVIYCFKKLRIKVDFSNPSAAQLKEISVFSGFVALTSIVDQINWSIDKILLGRMWGAAYTAVYSVAAAINDTYIRISTAISNVFIPRANRLVAENRPDSELTGFFIKIGRIQMLVLLPVLLGFIFFGQKFISLWTPKGYGEAYIITLLLIVPATIPLVQNIGIPIQMAQNKHQFRSLFYAGMALVNFALSVLLCRRYGAVGCAAATAVSLLFANGIAMNIYYHKSIGLNIIRFWKSMAQFLPTAAVTSAAGYAIMRFTKIDGWAAFIGWGAAFCAVYMLMAWFTAMNRSEKQIVYSIIGKIRRVAKG